jgi:DNA repair protein RecO (recombination protein O)
MEWRGEGIVCSVAAHGEANAVLRLLTADAGLLAGYVRGGASRRMRPILSPGNRLAAHWYARLDDQLGGFTVELAQSRAGVMLGDGLQLAGLDWLTTLTATLLPERDPHPGLFGSLDRLLDRMEVDAAPAGWLADLVRFDLQLLSDLGYGLDLTSCAATGQVDELAYVSPKSSQAVSAVAGAPYKERLLPLPAFLLQPNQPLGAASLRDGLKLSGFFLERLLANHAGAPKAAALLDVRCRLVQLAERRLVA